MWNAESSGKAMGPSECSFLYFIINEQRVLDKLLGAVLGANISHLCVVGRPEVYTMRSLCS